jgi:hypothetical protein
MALTLQGECINRLLPWAASHQHVQNGLGVNSADTAHVVHPGLGAQRRYIRGSRAARPRCNPALSPSMPQATPPLCICWHHLTCSPALQVQPKNAGRTRTLCRERPCFRTASSATRADGCDSNARSSTLAITKGAPVPSTRLIQAETLVHRRGFPLQLARITCHLPSDNNVSEQTPCETVPQAAPLLSDA